MNTVIKVECVVGGPMLDEVRALLQEYATSLAIDVRQGTLTKIKLKP